MNAWFEVAVVIASYMGPLAVIAFILDRVCARWSK